MTERFDAPRSIAMRPSQWTLVNEQMKEDSESKFSAWARRIIMDYVLTELTKREKESEKK